MKKITFTILLLGVGWVSGQVGINTTRPEKELTVNGTMKTAGIVLKKPMEKLGADKIILSLLSLKRQRTRLRHIMTLLFLTPQHPSI